ncbi:MAG: 50S ribosomal protein L15 [Candidatus Nealsonbacteria bacterium CG08_land_8_20_14_0_20_38_20]|uniref:Large ribosomal subunit protein uL15 n=1 Tax=Candidatus Nealsonbacteria bacterium CG08_land_8_20_14_0_20_38_20 TaxID=1974705 RepID=A0A2H0YPT9_9BACT|nr:MAG: 50S ribosomal protein L15 [Candidatus Nealsonbacteria bacterium CG08_land_8_20_14_0_20_38_20]
MQLHQIRPIHKPKKSKRIGRGGKKGHYSGRGMKGQKSRAGANFKPLIRDLFKRYPKLRGCGFKSKNKVQRAKIVILNLEILEKNFKPGEKINPSVLFGKGLIRRIRRKVPEVKILGKGETTKALIIEDCLVSKQAKEKIEKAGGEIKLKNKNEK